MRRYHMQKNGLMVEHTAYEVLLCRRKYDPRFKGARIRDVLQLRPSEIELGKVYECGTGEWKQETKA